MKYSDFKRYKFSTVLKLFNSFWYNFLKIFKNLSIKRAFSKKLLKNFDFNKFNISRYKQLFYFKKYNFSNLKIINVITSKFFVLHLPVAIIFLGFLYFFIPTFYSYEKSNFEKAICKNKNIECIINGKIVYNFYPTPRIKIKNITVNALLNKKYTILTAEEVLVKLSTKNLLASDKHKIKKVEFNKFETILNIRNFSEYKNIFNQLINNKPLILEDGTISFYDNNNYIASIRDVNLISKIFKESQETTLRGNFLNDKVSINLKTENIDNKSSNDLIFKMSNSNFLTKANFTKIQNNIEGNFLVKKDKNKIAGIFNYKNKKFTISRSNLRNTFIDGKLLGGIILFPYLDFNIDLNLNSINFTRLYNYFLSLDVKQQSNLFKISDKINGKLNFSADKVYSKHNLIKSFESRLKFYNGNINIEQFLINLGKIGAADILGTIDNEKKNTSFKFESNVFIDNQKKFFSKMGIYDVAEIFPNFFISGNFDTDNIKTSFYEISGSNKLSNDDINFIEDEFNNLMLENGFSDLFNFPKFKTFLKSITEDKF
tara:strand:- start:887 stop:2515 length:1629 start_codon:yes stop_codon:yes gene_type:complete